MLNKDYNFYLFDIDRTLWSFDKNAKSAIFKLIDQFFLPERFGIEDKEEFFRRYELINNNLWVKYEVGEIDKDFLREARFLHTFKSYFKNADSENNDYSTNYKKIKKLSDKFGTAYLEQMTLETVIEPGAELVLKTLKDRGKKIAVVSNGFKEVQYRKMKNSKLAEYIDKYIISEEVGFHKPDPRIFKTAIEALNADKSQTLMVGDNFPLDIEGAQIFGIDQYYYNPYKVKNDGGATYEYATLLDLI